MDKQSEIRQIVELYDTVEIKASRAAPVYLFSLREISPTGMGVLVMDDSDLLNQLRTS